jgi:hypothetical protein
LCQYIGNRSSVDEARSDGPEDETTVVEPDQGNGEIYIRWRREGTMLMVWDSPLTHHLAVATGCGFEQGGIANVHFGA